MTDPLNDDEAKEKAEETAAAANETCKLILREKIAMEAKLVSALGTIDALNDELLRANAKAFRSPVVEEQHSVYAPYEETIEEEIKRLRESEKYLVKTLTRIQTALGSTKHGWEDLVDFAKAVKEKADAAATFRSTMPPVDGARDVDANGIRVWKKCIVFGCTNHSNQGDFMGEMCAPCRTMLTTGKVGPTDSFIGQMHYDLEQTVQRNQKLKERLAERDDGELKKWEGVESHRYEPSADPAKCARCGIHGKHSVHDVETGERDGDEHTSYHVIDVHYDDDASKSFKSFKEAEDYIRNIVAREGTFHIVKAVATVERKATIAIHVTRPQH